MSFPTFVVVSYPIFFFFFYFYLELIWMFVCMYFSFTSLYYYPKINLDCRQELTQVRELFSLSHNKILSS